MAQKAHAQLLQNQHISAAYVLFPCRLTVDTVMTTQAPSQQSEDEDGVGFMARDDASRTTFRTRNVGDAAVNSNANNSETQEESQTDTSQLTESQTLR